VKNLLVFDNFIVFPAAPSSLNENRTVFVFVHNSSIISDREISIKPLAENHNVFKNLCPSDTSTFVRRISSVRRRRVRSNDARDGFFVPIRFRRSTLRRPAIVERLRAAVCGSHEHSWGVVVYVIRVTHGRNACVICSSTPFAGFFDRSSSFSCWQLVIRRIITFVLVQPRVYLFRPFVFGEFRFTRLKSLIRA